MLEITRQADYALRAVTEVARLADGDRIPTAVIAERQKIPLPFLAKIVSQLSVQGVLEATRGAGGGVRLALAQYRELAAFAQFASDLDEATRKQLERGRMVTELMKQPQYSPLQVWEMALTLFAVNNGYFDDIDVKKALSAERSMRDYLKGQYADLVNRMETNKDLSKEDETDLHDAIKDWKKNGTY